MRRFCVIAGVLLVVVLRLGGVAQELELEWEFDLHVLPELYMDTTEFELTYTFFDWEFFANLKYYTRKPPAGMNDYFMDLSFQVDGWLGPVDLDAGLVFDPLLGEGYESSYLEAKTSPWVQLDLSFKATHYAEKLYGSGDVSSYLIVNGAAEYEFPSGMSLGVDVNFDQWGCAGEALGWKDVSISLRDMGPFCGFYDAVVTLDCEGGFDALRLTGDDLVFFGSGLVVFNFDLEFTPTSKSFTLGPELKSPLVVGCVTIYQAFVVDPDDVVDGVAFYGAKFSCAFGECTKVDLGVAFDPSKVPGGFEGEEYEYFKAEFCAPGCCGKKLKGTFAAYFQESSTPIGLSRVVVTAEVPLTPTFSLLFEFESPGTLDIGWTLTF